MTLEDDLGTPFTRPGPRRVVSLVPSLTEAIAATCPDLLVGATDWCTHPADLDVARVRGTKNPDIDGICALEPDLVVANREENRRIDVNRLLERGIPVWVTVIETVPQALTSLGRLLTGALDQPEEPPWLTEAGALWQPVAAPVGTVAVPIWRDPWMVVGRDTFTGDLLARAGLQNVFAAHDHRYPKVDVAEIEAARPDLVLLPDEPYQFTPDDGPEAFSGPSRLVSGRLLTWYGPSLLEARTSIDALLAD